MKGDGLTMPPFASDGDKQHCMYFWHGKRCKHPRCNLQHALRKPGTEVLSARSLRRKKERDRAHSSSDEGSVSSTVSAQRANEMQVRIAAQDKEIAQLKRDKAKSDKTKDGFVGKGHSKSKKALDLSQADCLLETSISEDDEEDF